MHRHVVMVGNRRVHYRRQGDGPALILLHASPISSQVFEHDYAPVFSKRFTCIAPDTPGNGLSAPLANAETANVDDYASALIEFLNAIGVDSCILYGRHTGASIALRVSQMIPDRVNFVFCDGLPVFEPQEVETSTKKYLVPFGAEWTGSFLTWLWFRYRDQHVYWPWYDHNQKNRADTDVPDVDFLHRGVLDLLLAGNDYLAPYAAAFRAGAELDFRNTPVPTCFSIRPGDSLFNTQARITDIGENAWCEQLPRATFDAVLREMEIMEPHAGNAPAPPVRHIETSAGTISPRFVELGDGQFYYRIVRSKRPERPPLLMVPHMPGGGSYLEPIQEAISQRRDVILIDPPGHANSSVGNGEDLDESAQITVDALTKIGVVPGAIYGHRAGALLAAKLSLRIDVQELYLDDALSDVANSNHWLADIDALQLEPCWDGSHLTRLWHQLRDDRLWQPWNDRRRAAMRMGEAQFNLQRHYDFFLDIAKQPKRFAPGWRANFAAPTQPIYDRAKAHVWRGNWLDDNAFDFEKLPTVSLDHAEVN